MTGIGPTQRRVRGTAEAAAVLHVHARHLRQRFRDLTQREPTFVRTHTLPSESGLDVALDEPRDDAHPLARVDQALRVAEAALPPIALRKRSIDARRGSVRFHPPIEIGATPEPELGAPHPRAVGPA